MIWRTAIFAMLAGFATAAASQVVPVRSGEHAGFTRLAVDMPDRIAWRRLPRENGMTLLFETEEIRFDTTDVFRRLTSDRLVKISSPDRGGRLDLTLGCDCPVDLFWHLDNMLVIDIRDASVKEAGPPDPSDQQSPGNNPAALGKISPATDMLAASLSAPSPSAAAPVVRRRPSLPILRMHDYLEAEIRSAAVAGLLDPSDPRIAPSKNVEIAEQKDGARTSQINTNDATLHGNLNIALPGDLPRSSSATGGQDRVLDCLPDRLLRVADWAKRIPLTIQLGRLNRQLSQEFDRTDTGAALDLGRLYIHFGFGAEAMQVMSLDGVEGPSVEILREMADIVDNLHLKTRGRLHRDLGCPGLSAVWSVLAHEEIPTDALLDRSAILRSFQGLPDTLRRRFGPELSRRLTAAGHMETADMVLRANRHTRPAETPGRALALAELDFAEGRSDDATAALFSDLTRNTTHGAEAILGLIEHELDLGQQISYDVVQLAGAFYQQHRDEPIAPRLGRAYILGLAVSGAFREAQAEYSRITPALPEDAVRDIKLELTRLVTKRSEDIVFLQHAVKASTGDAETLPADLAILMAMRMSGLGFGDRAGIIMDNVPSSDRDSGYRLARAQLELSRGNPKAVETILEGMSGPQISRIKAQAKSAIGDYRAAEILYKQAKDENNAQRAAWLGRNWPSLTDIKDENRRQLAKILSQEEGPDLDLLQRSKVLISQSIKTRDALGAVLGNQTGSEEP